MFIETIPVGELETNCYLVADGQGGPGIVIDPGADPDKILAAADANGIKIGTIILTHAHWDHLGAVGALAADTGAKTLVHQLDADLLADPLRNLSGLALGEKISLQPDGYLSSDQIIKVGGLEINVIHTPGHTPGSVSLLTAGTLFCGDLVFYGSVGRTDLPGGDQERLHESIHSKVMTMPDSTIIYPGHGPSTTVGWERENNPYLIAGW